MNSLIIIPFLFDASLWLPIIIVGALIVLTLPFVIVLSIKSRKLRGSAFYKNIKNKEGAQALVDALGGKENVCNVIPNGFSRLSVELVNTELINREKLKELGVTNIIVMSQKVILVIKNQANEYASSLDDSLSQQDDSSDSNKE